MQLDFDLGWLHAHKIERTFFMVSIILLDFNNGKNKIDRIFNIITLGVEFIPAMSSWKPLIRNKLLSLLVFIQFTGLKWEYLKEMILLISFSRWFFSCSVKTMACEDFFYFMGLKVENSNSRLGKSKWRGNYLRTRRGNPSGLAWWESCCLRSWIARTA